MSAFRPIASRLRPFLGPAIVASAVWCAAGHITVGSADSSAIRLAGPAPAWVWLAAAAAALLVPGWRRQPRAALPALLSTVPWWPVALPPVALIWVGPLAWAPILLAACVAVGSAPLAAAGRLLRASDARRAVWLAGGATLAAGVLAAWSAAPRVPGGDEPHYLVITQSLIKDGDLQIENNHRNRDYASFFKGDLAPDFIRRGRNGAVYSIHAPGVSVVVLPAFRLFGYRGAQATILILAALTGALVWRTAWLATGDASAAWFAWAAIALSATFLLQSFMVFPDGPGTFVVAASTLLVILLARGEAVGPGMLVAFSVLLAGLPWLHTRFALLSGGFGLSIMWRLLADTTRPIAARRARVATFLAVPVASAIGWLVFFQVVYGTPNPAAPYGTNPDTRIANVPGGLMGLLFDEQFGLFAYAPVLALAVVGIWRAAEAHVRRATWELAGIAGVYLASAAMYWMWWAGRPATPARFAAAVLPALCVPAAILWNRASHVSRQILLALLGVSVAVTVLVLCVDRAGLAWNDRDALARWLVWLNPVVSLSRGWPSFFWSLDPTRRVTELSFVLHAVAWVGVFTAAWLVWRRWAGARTRTDAGMRVGTAWWLAVGVTLAVQAGWWMTGAAPLDAATSQVALLRDQGSQLVLGPFGWTRLSDPTTIVVLRGEPLGVANPSPPLLVLSSVPPGVYEVRMQTPRAGRVVARLGDGAPFETVDLLDLREQAFRLQLPAGAERLVLDADIVVKNSRPRVVIAPLQLWRSKGPLARAAARYGSQDVFFLDDRVFVEPEGFWVRGGETAEVVFVPPTGQSSVALTLRNGAVPNRVALRAGAFQRAVQLQPGEEVAVEVPLADLRDATPVAIATSAGFRPSDAPGNTDRRFLGVWVSAR